MDSVRAKCDRILDACARSKKFILKATPNTSVDEIKLRLEKLDANFSEFTTVTNQWYRLRDSEDYQDCSEDVDKFESEYYSTRVLYSSWLKNNEPTVTQPQSKTSEQSVISQLFDQQASIIEKLSTSTLNATMIGQSNEFVARLPKLDIKPFDGSSTDWIRFRDLFKSSVHEKENLSGACKLQYLKGFLRGEAENALKHVQITDDNYTSSWNRLSELYDKPKKIINAFIKSFVEMSPITHANPLNIRSISNQSDEIIRGLEVMGPYAASRDPWLIYSLLQKLDSETRQLWTRESNEKLEPSIDDFLKFLMKRCDAIEEFQSFSAKPSTSSTHRSSNSVKVHHSTSSELCPKCSSEHILAQCDQFKAMNITDRRSLVKTLRLCFNCLRVGHSKDKCRSKFNCRHCKAKHNSLVHLSNTSEMTDVSHSTEEDKTQTLHTIPRLPISQTTSLVKPLHPPNVAKDQANFELKPIENPSQSLLTSMLNQPDSHREFRPLLPTALVYVQDKSGQNIPCRTLLDSASQATFVTESLIHKLGLPRTRARISINGLGSADVGKTNGVASLTLSSRYDTSLAINVKALIMKRLTSILPSLPFDTSRMEYLKDLQLADPNFNQPNQIDIIIGAEKFFDILCDGKITGSSGRPAVQNTIFGWVIAGELNQPSTSLQSLTTIFEPTSSSLDSILRQFWEIEEVHKPKSFTQDELICEAHFKSTFGRQEDGRYVVKLPFKHECAPLGRSLPGAVSRQRGMEQRFDRQPRLRIEYTQFLNEYVDLKHMEKIHPDNLNLHENPCYLPHHGVFKDSSATSKLRVVFDASSKTQNGVSLNQILLVGPTIQRDLFSILVKFRLHKIAYTSDVEKMYRQIRVDQEDCDYQRIVWRSSPDKPIDHYRLLTVTYGIASAPYLATRVLHQLAEDSKDQYPEAYPKILQDFYVDDLMSGDNTEERAINAYHQISNALKSAGFHLRKWTSNSQTLLDQVPVEDRQTIPQRITNEDTSIKVLGIFWNPQSDSFNFKVTPSCRASTAISKRQLLSEAARLYDPLGWLAPTIIKVKIMFQHLWLLKLDWDDPLPDAVIESWSKLRQSFQSFENIQIPRWLSTSHSPFQLHGFCDASENAYAAAVYVRTTNEDGITQTHLITSKTRVAPIRQVSIPRLELCGAVLLTRLMISIKSSFGIEELPTYAWTDSKIVLAWLSSHPRRWKSFIANRTSEILDTIPSSHWRHVTSADNAADCASRGMDASALVGFNLWWKGPKWLQESEAEWPTSSLASHDCQIPEERITVQSFNVELNEWLEELTKKYSSLYKLISILTICYRFIENTRQKSVKRYGPKTASDFNKARLKLIFMVQQTSFQKDIDLLKCKGSISKGSNLKSLNPFIDDVGILRVGGRIANSNATFETKHPAILPQRHPFTELVIKEAHINSLHSGPSTTLSILRQRYWILGCKGKVRQHIHKCMQCFRHRNHKTSQLMGDLPKPRVQLTHPFTKSGVDYAGPIMLRHTNRRGAKTHKGYIALFICLCTKAIHIEVVSSLTSEAFIAALKRFTSRRGKCTDIYSDNGTNFVGARKQLSEMHNLLLNETNQAVIRNSLLNDGTTFHFIPPASPHFGGIWEAGIKSIKNHLKRVVGETILSFEEISTFLAQVEAILNSRPLCALAEDQMDPLTPGHFLIGHPITQIPEPDLSHLPISRLSRWQHLQFMTQCFWRRWHTEYLTSLQQRTKWHEKETNIKIGDLVLVKDNNLPPAKWITARIANVHPGNDGLVRVVTLKTSCGLMKRPVTKICLLPIY